MSLSKRKKIKKKLTNWKKCYKKKWKYKFKKKNNNQVLNWFIKKENDDSFLNKNLTIIVDTKKSVSKLEEYANVNRTVTHKSLDDNDLSNDCKFDLSTVNNQLL